MTHFQLGDPLEDFNWNQLDDFYDQGIGGRFRKVLGDPETHAPHLATFLPERGEPEFYFWLRDNLQGKAGQPQQMIGNIYVALTFWKLASTFPRISNELANNPNRLMEVQERLANLLSELPADPPPDATSIICLIDRIHPHKIFGMAGACTLPMRSTFLHFLYPDAVPVYDKMVLKAVLPVIEEVSWRTGDRWTFERYISHVWDLTEKYRSRFPNGARETHIRLVDMALWRLGSEL